MIFWDLSFGLGAQKKALQWTRCWYLETNFGDDERLEAAELRLGERDLDLEAADLELALDPPDLREPAGLELRDREPTDPAGEDARLLMVLGSSSLVSPDPELLHFLPFLTVCTQPKQPK